MNETNIIITICVAFVGWCFSLEQRLAKKVDKETFDEAQRRERSRLDADAKEDRESLEKHLDNLRDRMEERDRISNEFKERIREELHQINLKLQIVLPKP